MHSTPYKNFFEKYDFDKTQKMPTKTWFLKMLIPIGKAEFVICQLPKKLNTCIFRAIFNFITNIIKEAVF